MSSDSPLERLRKLETATADTVLAPYVMDERGVPRVPDVSDDSGIRIAPIRLDNPREGMEILR